MRNYKVLKIQKRIVSAETIGENTVDNCPAHLNPDYIEK